MKTKPETTIRKIIRIKHRGCGTHRETRLRERGQLQDTVTTQHRDQT